METGKFNLRQGVDDRTAQVVIRFYATALRCSRPSVIGKDGCLVHRFRALTDWRHFTTAAEAICQRPATPPGFVDPELVAPVVPGAAMPEGLEAVIPEVPGTARSEVAGAGRPEGAGATMLRPLWSATPDVPEAAMPAPCGAVLPETKGEPETSLPGTVFVKPGAVAGDASRLLISAAFVVPETFPSVVPTVPVPIVPVARVPMGPGIRVPIGSVMPEPPARGEAGLGPTPSAANAIPMAVVAVTIDAASNLFMSALRKSIQSAGEGSLPAHTPRAIASSLTRMASGACHAG